MANPAVCKLRSEIRQSLFYLSTFFTGILSIIIFDNAQEISSRTYFSFAVDWEIPMFPFSTVGKKVIIV
jgi:hypothetical protein